MWKLIVDQFFRWGRAVHVRDSLPAYLVSIIHAFRCLPGSNGLSSQQKNMSRTDPLCLMLLSDCLIGDGLIRLVIQLLLLRGLSRRL